MKDSVFGPVRETFHELAKTIVPEAEALDERAWKEFDEIIERGVASRPAKIKRQLRLFVRVLNFLPVAQYGKTFLKLLPDKRTVFLHSVENSPLLIIRRGFWGVRTFVYMGFYNLDEVRTVIGYRAHPDGWEARR